MTPVCVDSRAHKHGLSARITLTYRLQTQYRLFQSSCYIIDKEAVV